MNITEIINKQKQGLLDYKWKLRFLIFIKNKHLNLIGFVKSPFIYLSQHLDNIKNDTSLNSICQLCTDPNLITNIDWNDYRLSYLAYLFNKLTHSGRELHMCYDCGTVGRAVFFQLIKAYRGKLKISHREIERIKNEYYMDRYEGSDGVEELQKRVHTIQKNCVFICALQLGDSFGHIYILEKIYINGTPRFRIYQSCLNAFLLVDYIEHMDYASHLLSGIDVDAHLKSVHHLISTPSWGPNEIKSFIQWFKFTPKYGKTKTEKKLFTSTYITF